MWRKRFRHDLYRLFVDPSTLDCKKRFTAMAKKPTKGQKKVENVMCEYKSGSLKSSSGKKVTSRNQAVAIAMSEAGMTRKKRKK